MRAPRHPSAEWWRRDAERNERVRRARLRRDATKPPGTNLEEGSDLVRFAHEFAAAFEKARSSDRPRHSTRRHSSAGSTKLGCGT